MNSKDYRNIREAYLNVYEQEEVLDEVLDTPGRANEYTRKNVRSMLGAFAKGVVNKDISQLKTIEKRKRGAELGKRKAERKAAEEQKEQVDLYDIILSHLIDEGYADTEEAAERIMVNMSEEWKESIVVEDIESRREMLKQQRIQQRISSTESQKRKRFKDQDRESLKKEIIKALIQRQQTSTN